ncbi:sensor histidine kinase [Flavihumibacter sp. UBA7668]|uniref:sensor histidine kinase n=1 Tax=Flavihumibacter sp. UBA7668 TaxID=1946542 RepID=UPI0025B99B9E|nr:sensor histidine kinase [Flavihumibacter sp. UBA7668]
MEWLIVICCLLFLTAAFFAFQYVAEMKKNQEFSERLTNLTREVKTAELERISFKLNPHLFRNTLNSIQSHAYQTYHALDKLSEVLDYILYESDKTRISIKEEIDFILNFVEINRLKVSPLFDIRIKNSISPNNEYYSQQLLTPLITVNLVENAFKHADLQSPDAFISIHFEIKNDQFCLTISNKISDGQAVTKQKGGFGKNSLETRLQALHAGNFTLKQFVENQVYIAQLKINLLDNTIEMPSAG